MKTMCLKSKLKMILSIVALFAIFSCNRAEFKEDLLMETVDVSENFESLTGEYEEDPQEDYPKTGMPKDLKIIKSASVKYKVVDVKIATAKIKTIAVQYESYVSDLRFNNDLYQKENRFTLKVPQEHFDQVMDSIGAVAMVIEFENITTKDVTEEYIDIQARLKTKLEVKARYEAVLRKNAKTVEDILLTEDKLRVIQEEIESAQGRLKYLTSKVAYSTIQIDLYETVDYTPEPTSYRKSFLDKSKNGFISGWELVEAIVLFFIHIWPLLIGLGILLFVLRKKLRK